MLYVMISCAGNVIKSRIYIELEILFIFCANRIYVMIELRSCNHYTLEFDANLHVKSRIVIEFVSGPLECVSSRSSMFHIQ